MLSPIAVTLHGRRAAAWTVGRKRRLDASNAADSASAAGHMHMYMSMCMHMCMCIYRSTCSAVMWLVERMLMSWTIGLVWSEERMPEPE